MLSGLKGTEEELVGKCSICGRMEKSFDLPGTTENSESPGIYVETFVVDSWAEHQRQHDRFTIADRTVEEQVFRFAREPLRVRHFIYARTSRRK